jgi:hypothetical protein
VEKTLRKPAKVIAPIVIAIMTAFAAANAHAQATPINANDDACFPMCGETMAAQTAEIEPPKADACNSQSSNLIKQAEQLNDRVKPIKEIVGYVRSPQGLAIKLVNDHVVKIPAWVGYAMDPVGSLKNRAMAEVRTRAKSAIGLNRAPVNCAAEIAAPIDAALIPIDTQQI